MELAGLLCHAGNSYACRSKHEILTVQEESLKCLEIAKTTLEGAGIEVKACSTGDSPGCSISDSFAPATEIRPGNFVYYDCMQMQITSCGWEDIAVALAAPVISVRPEKGQLILHGGAVHLSKDHLQDEQGFFYGKLARPCSKGWSEEIDGLRLEKLSQEHGIVKGSAELIASFKPGDLLMVLPVHSCLTVDLMREAYLPDGSPVDGRPKG